MDVKERKEKKRKEKKRKGKKRKEKNDFLANGPYSSFSNFV